MAPVAEQSCLEIPPLLLAHNRQLLGYKDSQTYAGKLSTATLFNMCMLKYLCARTA